jgi:hypothetical protein
MNFIMANLILYYNLIINNKGDFMIKKGVIVSIAIGISLLILGCEKKNYKGDDDYKNYKYIFGSGVVSSEEGLKYILKRPIDKNLDKVTKITLSDININEVKNEIKVKVEGEFCEPNEISKIEIGNRKKSARGYVVASTSGNSGANKWVYECTFKYYKKYKHDNIKFTMNWENGDTIEFNTKLVEVKSESDVKKLGITDTKCNTTINAMIEEKGNILDVNFINIKDLKSELTFFGQEIRQRDVNSDYARKQKDVVKLTDSDKKFTVGAYIEHPERSNHFKFDTTNLKKPYAITIPEISVFTRDENIISEEIELNIESDNVETTINKLVEFKTSSYIYKNANNKVKLIKGIRDGDKYTLYIQNLNNDKNPMKIESVYIKPSGDSIKDVNADFFEGGISGGVEDENVHSYTFKLPYPKTNKLFIKLEINRYKIAGNWSFTVD